MAAAERRELVDARGTVLRVSRHDPEQAVVLSIWREGRCLGTFHLADAQVATVLDAIQSASPPRTSPGADAGSGNEGVPGASAGDIARTSAGDMGRASAGDIAASALAGASAGRLAASRGGDRPGSGPALAPHRVDEPPGLREAAQELEEALRALEVAASPAGQALPATQIMAVPAGPAGKQPASKSPRTNEPGTTASSDDNPGVIQPASAGPDDATRLLPGPDDATRLLPTVDDGDRH